MNFSDFDGLILDWDGVFTDGKKDLDGSTSFNELDLMGLNLLRFGFFLKTGKMLHVAILSGERNPTAEFVAKREHIDMFIHSCKNKASVIELITNSWESNPDKWMFVFDDVLDFSLARIVGFRGMVIRNQTTHTSNFAKNLQFIDLELPDLLSIRYFSERLLHNSSMFESTINERLEWSERYANYWDLRNSISTIIVDNDDSNTSNLAH